MATKYILIGGHPYGSPDGGKVFIEELVRGFGESVKILECLFARPRSVWPEDFNQDKRFLENGLPDKKMEFLLTNPENFKEQVIWSNVIYIRGGISETVVTAIQKYGDGWEKELFGKTVAGSSAGAHAISKYYYDLDDMRIREGLGLLPIKILTHYGSDYNAPNINWNKVEAELRQYKEDLPLIKLAEGQFEIMTQ